MKEMACEIRNTAQRPGAGCLRPAGPLATGPACACNLQHRCWRGSRARPCSRTGSIYIPPPIRAAQISVARPWPSVPFRGHRRRCQLRRPPTCAVSILTQASFFFRGPISVGRSQRWPDGPGPTSSVPISAGALPARAWIWSWQQLQLEAQQSRTPTFSDALLDRADQSANFALRAHAPNTRSPASAPDSASNAG